MNILFLLFNLVSSSAQALPLQNGFYLFQNQKVLWVYADLIAHSQGKLLGNFAVDAKGAIQPVAQSGGLTRLEDFRFLGMNQKLAAQALGRSGSDFSPTIYLAHRGTAQIPVLGSSSVFPGNTKAAMSLALENGYRGFEFDVQMTKDKQFLVSHDEDLSVSTSCTGKVSDYNLAELAQCKVLFTGLIPEETVLHSPAEQAQSMPSLKDVLQTYLSDSRVSHLVIDTKPGNINDQVMAFNFLLNSIPASLQTKLVFLIRDLQIETKLKALGKTVPVYALEGSEGWEPLQGGLNPDAHAISLSLGIGLGLAGQQGQGILSVLMSLPEFIWQGVQNNWQGGSVDIGCIQWIPDTMRVYLKLEADLEARKVPVIGWTVNTQDKVNWLRTWTPHLPALISDLPFSEIAQLEVAELEKVRVLP